MAKAQEFEKVLEQSDMSVASFERTSRRRFEKAAALSAFKPGGSCR